MAKWMQQAVHPERRGEFTRKARAADMSVGEYASAVRSGRVRVSTRTKQQANFAIQARKIAARRRRLRGAR